MMPRLIAKGIIRSYSMRQRRIAAAVKPPNGNVSNSDVCGGLMFNAQRYMHVNDAYFAPSTIRFPYELKKIFDRILHELQYLDKVHPHHFTLDLVQLDKIFEYRAGSSYPFPVTNVAVEYMFDTLGFLWLHHDRPSFLLYLLEELRGGSTFFYKRVSKYFFNTYGAAGSPELWGQKSSSLLQGRVFFQALSLTKFVGTWRSSKQLQGSYTCLKIFFTDFH